MAKKKIWIQKSLPIRGYTWCDFHPLASFYADLHKWNEIEDHFLLKMEDEEEVYEDHEWEYLENSLRTAQGKAWELCIPIARDLRGFWVTA